MVTGRQHGKKVVRRPRHGGYLGQSARQRWHHPVETLRQAVSQRTIEARPTGTPTWDRHTMETAHQWEHEEQPSTRSNRPTPGNDK